MTKLVMVLNHTEDILYLMEEILKDCGYKVTLGIVDRKTAQNIPKVNPDLLIIDPAFGRDFEGIELIQQLRLDKKTAHIPIILCTAAIQVVKNNLEELKSKSVRVLLSPFELEDFIEAVEAEIGLP